jgi:trk system potassium uptake protein TrkH
VIDPRPILFVLGVLLLVLAGGMLVPLAADLLLGEGHWHGFFTSAAITLFVGGLLVLAERTRAPIITLRQAFLLTTGAWLTACAFAALPFVFSRLNLSLTDAFFEATAGLTTTGSTVITGLDVAPRSILLWRSLLQWAGGIGIIAMAIAVLPMLRIGGMQLFHTEFSDRSEKALPRARQVAEVICFIYLGLTVLCAAAYAAAGMAWFEAINHAMTTVSTAGHSTSDGSIAHFDSAAVEWIAVVFMLAGALPFMLYARTLLGRRSALWGSSQVRTLLGLLAAVILVTTLLAWRDLGLPFFAALRLVTFNVTSVVTTTGYATADYGAWGGYAIGLFFALTFVGGCTGSTAGGVKIFRFQVMYLVVRQQVVHLVRPAVVYRNLYDDRPLPDAIPASVMAFGVLYVAAFGLLTFALAALGLDFLTSASGAATALANVGPGLGEIIGPAGNFAPLPAAAKWLLAFGMLLGRLELFTVLVVLTPWFWRG